MKLLKKNFMIFVLFILISMFFIPKDTRYTNIIKPIEYFDRVKDTEYYDWSETQTLDQNYSFSTIYLTEKTEFKIFKNEGTLEWTKTESGKELPNIKNLGKGKEIIMLITNCAVNKDGEVLDVLMKIDNVIAMENNGIVNLTTNGYVTILDSQNYPSKGTKIYSDVGKPMIFQLESDDALCDFTMTYYKHGTYDYNSNIGVLGGIEYVNGLFNDIDITNHGKHTDNFLQGNEGIRPNVGSSVIYYNKNKKQPTDTSFKNTVLQEIDNGIAVKSIEKNSNGLWYAHSALVLTKDISNSTYSFTYGGVGCGIDYFFSSPYPYEMTDPIKKVSIDEVTTKQEFSYNIIQYIPNNYYATLFNYGELYNNLYSNSRFTSITIKDNFNKFLEINKEKIIITDEINNNVTNKFEITLNNNELIIQAKANNFDDPNFYNHTYTIQIPTILSDDVKGIANIKNKSTTISEIGEEEKNLVSNEVSVDILYKLSVNYLKEKTNKVISDPIIRKYKLNDSYTTDYPNVKGLELVNIPTNASGTINEDTIVNYFYREPIIIEEPKEEPKEEPIIENPNTGNNVKFIIGLLFLLLIAYWLKKYHKKIYKI